jgi:hypothetical protein
VADVENAEDVVDAADVVDIDALEPASCVVFAVEAQETTMVRQGIVTSSNV